MAPQPHTRPHRYQLLGIRSHIRREPQWPFESRARQEYEDLHERKEHGGRPHTYGGVDMHTSLGYSFSAPSLAATADGWDATRGLGGSGSGASLGPDPGTYKLDDRHTTKRPPSFGFGTTSRGGGLDPWNSTEGAGPGPAAYDCRGGGFGGGAKYSMKGRGQPGQRGDITPAPGYYGDCTAKRGGLGPKWGSPPGGAGGMGVTGANGNTGFHWAPGPDYMPRGLGGGGYSMGTAQLPSKKTLGLARTLPPTYTQFGHHGK